MKKDNRCFNCQKPGHHAKDCKAPKRQMKAMKRNHGTMEGLQGPTTEQEQWVQENPLHKRCVHENYKRSSDGRLWETFITNGQQKTRLIRTKNKTKAFNRMEILQEDCHHNSDQNNQEKLEEPKLGSKEPRSTPSTNKYPDAEKEDRELDQHKETAKKDTRPCTLSWCQKQGRRHKDVTKGGFKRKCDKTCLPWNCTSCGTPRQETRTEQRSDGGTTTFSSRTSHEDGALYNSCIETGECLDCQWKNGKEENWHKQQEQEKEIQIQYALQTGRVRPSTRWLIPEIEERAHHLPPQKRAAILNSIKQVEEHELDEAEYWEAVPAHVEIFQEIGTTTFRPETQECRICQEEDSVVSHISDCGTILACKACAIGWTEYARKTKWKRLSKNE
jgi:hypothetical protein